MLHLATSNTTEHFSIIVAILVGIVGMVATMLKGLWTFFSSLNTQLEAIKVNSEAITRMNTRMDRLEARVDKVA